MQTRVVVFLAAVLLVPAVALAVPGQVAHQGYLSDDSGPVTADLEMVFRLYDDQTGGTALWTETRTLSVVGGHYSALLGPEDDDGTQLSVLLLQEPALFLEVTIGSDEPLLPRQAIASVPYAVAAGTAESVVGGSVDASELRVGGASIIDSSGNWTGPAIASGTPAWSNLTGVPADLADGDADALGALSCQDGEPATWSVSQAQWVCGGLVVDLDSLDTLGASADQVLTFDGSQAAWSTPTGAAGCTLTPQNYELATLSCGSSEVRVALQEEFIDTIYSFVQLRADGTIKTSGSGPPPAGTFTTLGGHYSYPCAIDSAGAIHCWRYTHVSGGTALAAPPQGSYTKVDCSSVEACCALSTAQTVTCWSPNGHLINGSAPGVSNSPAGTFLDFAIANNSTGCGITTAGSIQCWGDNNVSNVQSNAPSGGAFELIGARNFNFCVLGPQGGECFSNQTNHSFNSVTLPAGNYVGIAVGLTKCQGLLDTGAVVTSDGSYVGPNLTTLGHYWQNSNRCGVTVNGLLYCGQLAN